MRFPFAAISAAILSTVLLVPATAQLGADDHGDVRCNPDPHFITFDNTYYDYHGGCDLVLIKNALLDIHIRTVPTSGYSYISHAAVRIGGDTLEVRDDDTYYVNGALQTSPPASIGGKPFSETTTTGGTTFELTLDNGQYVRIEMWGPVSSSGSLSVHVHGHGSDFGDSVGMGGMWNMPGLIGRDYVDYISNTTELALSWQVNSGQDPILFMDAGELTCLPPIYFGGCTTGADGQCDDKCGGKCVDRDDIEEACKHIDDPDQRKNCEFDVETTGDTEWGKAPFYQDPLPPMLDARCTANKGNHCARLYGGECVWKCHESPFHKCLPDLCEEAEPSRPGDLDSSMLRQERPSKPIKDKDPSKPIKGKDPSEPIKDKDCPDCSCKVPTAGFYHNEVLAYLQKPVDFNGVELMEWPREWHKYNADMHEEMLDGAGDFMIKTLFTEDDLTKAVVQEIKDLMNLICRRNSQGEDICYYIDIASLMILLRGLPSDCKVSRGLENALDRVLFEAKVLELDSAASMPKLHRIVEQNVLDVQWESEKDKDFVRIFQSVYEASIDYWGKSASRRRRRRIPRWLTILADAIGGAIGGAAGAAAGGPVGAGIGAGLFGAAVSHVFSS